MIEIIAAMIAISIPFDILLINKLWNMHEKVSENTEVLKKVYDKVCPDHG